MQAITIISLLFSAWLCHHGSDMAGDGLKMVLFLAKIFLIFILFGGVFYGEGRLG